MRRGGRCADEKGRRMPRTLKLMRFDTQKLCNGPQPVVVGWVARPELQDVAAGKATAREVNAAGVSLPLNGTTRSSPLLIRVVGTACPNLQLLSVGVVTAGDIETLVAVDHKCVASASPFLSIISTALLDFDHSTVSVGVGTETPGSVSVGVDEMRAGRGRTAGR